jgi:mRNA-degrading endonuclease YafQ of YafQ-DinJ toxin-antitoxin module
MRFALHHRFEKKLDRLPSNIKEKFFERLELFLQEPWHPTLNNHSVEKAFPGRRSINITGDYRAVFRMYGDLAFFSEIGTHSELYS